MSSYNHFCFLQHIRSSAFPHVNPNAVLPSAEGSLRDALAETCYFYAQNLPTIVTLLPRAGLALALLLSFFSPENLPGGLTLSDVDQSIARRDGTFFDKSTGALSAYAKGVLIANAAWAAWRTLVLLLSWYVLFFLVKSKRRLISSQGRPLDVQRVWLRGALWAPLTLGGGRSWPYGFDPKRKIRVGRGRGHGCQWRRCTSLELERMQSPTRV
jgi:hypothetical protein